MSNAALSIRVFGIYLFCLGALLIIIPGAFLTVFGFPEAGEVLGRVAGVLLVVLAYYYVMASTRELVSFYRWTVHGRLSVLLFFIAFVLLGLAPPVLILFGGIDASAALWTAACLRKDRAAGTLAPGNRR
ncbi:MAG: hypothetical protein ACREVE_12395 [Gammaproteobacteria bacterium]